MEAAGPRVSIIVPIYNVERYLRQCVDSLLRQTLKDLEIILLNDGSTDNSPAICDMYAATDARIRVIHKANTGYGATMNLGLREARGEYIGIIESDDWAEHDMFESLYALAKEHNAQVVKSNFYEYTDACGDILMRILPEGDLNRIFSPKQNSDIFYAQSSIWSAIYSRSFLQENGIDFRESPGASYQDNAFNFKVWARAERVWLTDRPLVHYRRDNEQASVKSDGKVFCMADEWAEIDRYMDRYPDDKKASAQLRLHVKALAYLWNWERLRLDKRAAFEEVIVREFRDAMDAGIMRKRSFYPRDWARLHRIVYKGSISAVLRYWLSKLSRLIVKPKLRGGKLTWLILGGLIKLKGKPVHSGAYVYWASVWPSFYDKQRS